jgi:outer membrane protein OmpA-like peptidoglycan-associated protein
MFTLKRKRYGGGMFGNNNDNQQVQDAGLGNEPAADAPQPAITNQDNPAAPPAGTWGSPQPAATDDSAPAAASPSAPQLAPGFEDLSAAAASPPEPSVDSPAASTATGTVGGSNDLLDIKQKALQELNPLVEHLDQNPEEKFRTTMMMIQASDNEDLVKDAFEAAKQITDDKARAQALLDIINEINYFTQNHGGN